MTGYWLGVDIGTGSSRAILLDSSGAEAAAVSIPHEEMRMEQPLWAEQRPENWADASFEAIQGALAAANITGNQVRGVGL
ncbi:MAG TPA: FGGY family carbohydrate kinase, partial [Bryobacteraceae bacterium]|nr:FGGY family carbohydrate kinase [Bryobacteraceae bacterium]